MNNRTTLIALALTVVAVTAITAQDFVTIDASNMTQDDLVSELILDPDSYAGQPVMFENLIYAPFGTRASQTAFYQCNSWFRDPQTYGFTQTDMMYDYAFTFWFHPETVEGRRFAMELNGYTYRVPKQVSIGGIFVQHTLNTGRVLNLFLVAQLTIDGETYYGTLPDSLTN